MLKLSLTEAVLGRETSIRKTSSSLLDVPSTATIVVETFRKLAEFHEDYDETVLSDIAAMLGQRMSPAGADLLLRDALVMDNELRFRRPGGLTLRMPGDASLSEDESAHLRLIAVSDDVDDTAAMAMAERLGVRHSRVLRRAAGVLARHLDRANGANEAPNARSPVASTASWRTAVETPP
jgi:hypothetical protein